VKLLTLHSRLCNGFLFLRFLYGDQARFFSDEIHIDLKHSKTGTVAMASAGENLNASQVWHVWSRLRVPSLLFKSSCM